MGMTLRFAALLSLEFEYEQKVANATSTLIRINLDLCANTTKNRVCPRMLTSWHLRHSVCFIGVLPGFSRLCWLWPKSLWGVSHWLLFVMLRSEFVLFKISLRIKMHWNVNELALYASLNLLLWSEKVNSYSLPKNQLKNQLVPVNCCDTESWKLCCRK